MDIKHKVSQDSDISQQTLALEKAKKKVRRIKDFYRSLTSAAFTILIVGSVNYYLNKWSHPWFLWVVFGLSISLFFKALKVYDISVFSKDWEERKIKEYMDKDKFN